MLIGRDGECRALDRLVAEARLGRSGVLVITGEAGVGKSTLLDYVDQQANGIDVVRVAGTEAERDLAFGVLVLALAPSPDDLMHIPAPQATALRVALAMERGQPVDRFAVGAATLSVLSRRAESGPTALLLDDAHLLDRPSAEAIVFAARRLLADPVLLVAALRSNEPSPLLAAGLPTMVVAGLDEAGTVALLRERRGATAPAALSQRVHRATGGNPLAIIELSGDERSLSALSGGAPLPVPAALAQSFVRRADALAPTATTLLSLCEAAAGDLRVVIRAARKLRIGPVVLEAAESADLVRVGADRVTFTHPLVGSSAYASLTPQRRRDGHAAVEAALPADDLARRAWHRAAAALGPDEGAARAVERVAGDSRRRGAYAAAAAAYERSAQLTDADAPRAVRLVEAADAAWLGGDATWALRLLDEAAAVVPRFASDARALALRGEIAARGGALDEARKVLLEAARQTVQRDPSEALRLAGEIVDVAFYLADGDAAVEAEQLALSVLAQGVSGSASAIGHLAVGMAQVLDGRDGSEHVRRGARLLDEEHVRISPEFDATWLMFGALFLREEGSTRRMLTAVEEARAETALGALPHLLFHLARDGATTDRWVAAQSDYTEAIALAQELTQTTEEAVSLAGLAWLEARLGSEEECRVHAARALDLAGPRHITIAAVWAQHALAELALAAGRVDEAVHAYGELDAFLAGSRTRDVDLSPAPELVELLVRTGDVERARRVARQHAERASVKGQPWSLARAGRAAGMLSSDGDLDATFGPALELHQRTPDAFETARTQLVYGARLRRARRRADARAPLEKAQAAFDALGARVWADAAADELEASGVPVARRGLNGLDLLTPRERQIVTLLAEGRTTRATAAALFLSPKTVEYHLRHVYTKLGIVSRGELIRLATTA